MLTFFYGGRVAEMITQLIFPNILAGLRVANNFGCRALYKLPWRASVSLVVVRFNATFLLLWLYCEKMYTSFMNDAVARMHSDCLIHPRYLNITTAFYSVTECSNVTVFV